MNQIVVKSVSLRFYNHRNVVCLHAHFNSLDERSVTRRRSVQRERVAACGVTSSLMDDWSLQLVSALNKLWKDEASALWDRFVLNMLQ